MDLSKFARYPSLEGVPVLVTGGGSGIGAAIVEAFVDQGAKVAFLDIDDTASAVLVRDLERQYGRAAAYRRCDLRDIDDLRRAIGEAGAAIGDIAVLVNNAARDDRHSWESVTPPYWDEMMAVNLRHYFFATQAVLPRMQTRRRGSIVNVGSISWEIKNGGYPAYTAAKAAVHGLTTSAARDFGKQGIRVNTVMPGWVMTERQLKLWVTPQSEAHLDTVQLIPGRIAPADLARMVLFLASDDARMCTGQDYYVDAGWA